MESRQTPSVAGGPAAASNPRARRPGGLVGEIVASLNERVQQSQWPAGHKLPSESEIMAEFEVSRTVVREAVSRLKSLGLVDSRQGSGVFVRQQLPFAPLQFEARQAASQEAVIQMVEVRRALEAEAAALAAERRSASDLLAIEQSVQALEQAVQSGGDGVAEDVHFHRAIAEATHNPFLIQTLGYLSQFLHGATQVTRANEARRGDFTAAVRSEHQAILQAVRAGDSSQARQVAAAHMGNAIGRIRKADPAFWVQEGERLAQPLVKGLQG